MFLEIFNSSSGGVAEWSCSGLQSRVRRFDSDPRLQLETRAARPGPDVKVALNKGAMRPLAYPPFQGKHAGAFCENITCSVFPYYSDARGEWWNWYTQGT